MVDVNLKCGREDVARQYARMISDGIPARKIDADADGSATCSEVIETSLERAESYQKFLKGMTTRPVPWLLSDAGRSDRGDVRSDRAARRSVARAIRMTKGRLARQGIDPDALDYKRKLAYSLYCFAMMFTGEHIRKYKPYNPTLFEGMPRSLKGWGIREMRLHLEREGGLGLVAFPKDAAVEATALEALSQQAGVCTERSKVIYAIFEEAGLDPVFAHMSARDLIKSWADIAGSQASPPVTPQDYLGGHVVVGVPDGEGYRYYEPNVFMPDASYDEYARPISLTEMYHADMGNLIGDLLIAKKPNVERAEEVIEGAKALGETKMLAFVLWGESVLMNLTERNEDAIHVLKRAIEIDPNFEQARVQLCLNLGNLAKWDECERCLRELPEDMTQRHEGLATLTAQQGRFDEARGHFLKLMETGGDKLSNYISIASIYQFEGSLAEAERYARRAYSMNGESTEAGMLLANLLVMKESKEAADEAVVLLKPILAMDSTNISAVTLMAGAMRTSGESDISRRYFDRALAIMVKGRSFDFALYRPWMLLADYHDMEVDVARAALKVLTNGSTELSLATLYLDCVSRMEGMRDAADETFGKMIEFFPTFFAANKVPADLYWDMAAIAGRLGRLGELADLYQSLDTYSDNQIFALHAAWKGGDAFVMGRHASLFDAMVGELVGMGAEEIDPAKLEPLCKAIDSMPADFLKGGQLRFRLGRIHHLLAEIYEHRGRPRDALAAYYGAIRLGERDPLILEAIEGLEGRLAALKGPSQKDPR